MRILILLWLICLNCTDGVENVCTHSTNNSNLIKHICQRNKECYDGNMISSATITCANISFGNSKPGYKIKKYEYYDQNSYDYIMDEYPVILKIINSNISVLPANAFEDFSKLTVLFLNDSNIQNMVPDTFKFQLHIKEIHLENNNLSVLPDTVFTTLPILSFLNLSNNNIEVIPDKLFEGTLLSFLFISNNKIKQFFNIELLSSLTSLSTLDLSFNQISQVRFSTDNSTLQVLLLNNNNIRKISLPKSIINLRQVDLSNNDIDDLTIEKNDNLRFLDISYNKITHLTGNIFGKKLDTLNVSNNLISLIDPDAFKGLSELSILLLNHNNLTQLSNMVFKDAEILNYLDLSANNISKFSNGTFDTLKNLTYLNISYNQFQQLPQYIFHSLQNLQGLYFQGNNISNINVDDLRKQLPQLKNVSLAHNDWDCKTLLDIVHRLKINKIDIDIKEPKPNSNVFGVECKENENQQQAELKRLFHDNIMYRFMEDFQNNNVFQYLENLNNYVDMMIKKNSSEYIRPGNVSNFLKEINATFESFLNKYSKVIQDHINNQCGTIINSIFKNPTYINDVCKKTTNTNSQGFSTEKLDIINELSIKFTVMDILILIFLIIIIIMLSILVYIMVIYIKENNRSDSSELRPLLQTSAI